MVSKPVVTIECDYGPTTLWTTPTDERLAEMEQAAVDPGGRWVPGGIGPLPDPWAERLSEDLLSRLWSWGREWEENGADWAESDLFWLRQGDALTNEVRQELGADYDVVYGYEEPLRRLETRP